jgi:hypothetical protein
MDVQLHYFVCNPLGRNSDPRGPSQTIPPSLTFYSDTVYSIIHSIVEECKLQVRVSNLSLSNLNEALASKGHKILVICLESSVAHYVLDGPDGPDVPIEGERGSVGLTVRNAYSMSL